MQQQQQLEVSVIIQLSQLLFLSIFVAHSIALPLHIEELLLRSQRFRYETV